MTWAEFCIRKHAYLRMDKQNWYKVREIAYAAMVGSHMPVKDLPKSREAFIQLEEKKSIDKELLKETIRKAQEDYIQAKQK
ncbi:hypothetical protein N9928_01140 [bacterium]|nr:hypothetical protein [bacterium]